MPVTNKWKIKFRQHLKITRNTLKYSKNHKDGSINTLNIQQQGKQGKGLKNSVLNLLFFQSKISPKSFKEDILGYKQGNLNMILYVNST